MTTSHDRDLGPHAGHDRLLIAAHAAGNLAASDLELAESILAACPDCRSLHDDLRAIAASTHDLPAPARPTGLDFRISAEDAARLAPGGWSRRWLRPFRTTGWATLRPLAAGLTTLGLAGLLLTVIPSFQLGAGGAAVLSTVGAAIPPATQEQNRGAATAAPTVAGDTTGAASSAVPPGGSPVPLGPASGATAAPVPTADEAYGSASGSPVPAAPGDGTSEFSSGGKSTGEASAESGGPSVLAVASVALLALGLALFALRRLAIRLD